MSILYIFHCEKYLSRNQNKIFQKRETQFWSNIS